jgi:hypothetical protein
MPAKIYFLCEENGLTQEKPAIPRNRCAREEHRFYKNPLLSAI